MWCSAPVPNGDPYFILIGLPGCSVVVGKENHVELSQKVTQGCWQFFVAALIVAVWLVPGAQPEV